MISDLKISQYVIRQKNYRENYPENRVSGDYFNPFSEE